MRSFSGGGGMRSFSGGGMRSFSGGGFRTANVGGGRWARRRTLGRQLVRSPLRRHRFHRRAFIAAPFFAGRVRRVAYPYDYYGYGYGYGDDCLVQQSVWTAWG